MVAKSNQDIKNVWSELGASLGDGGWHAKSSELGEPFRAIFSLVCASSWPNRRIYDDFRRFAQKFKILL